MVEDTDAPSGCSSACRCPMMRMVSHYELHCDEVALWHRGGVLFFERVLQGQKWAAYSSCPGCEPAKQLFRDSVI